MEDKKSIWKVIVIINILVFVILCIFMAIVVLNNNKTKKEESLFGRVGMYLYPTETMDINVSFKNKDNLSDTFPEYKDGWNVIADKNGILEYKKTDNYLYNLYYSVSANEGFINIDEGFVIKKGDVGVFLNEKLDLIGLNRNEKELLIDKFSKVAQYSNCPYFLVKFATDNDIEKLLSPEITPKPDTIINSIIVYKRLKNPIEIKEQTLTKKPRNGFTVVNMNLIYLGEEK